MSNVTVVIPYAPEHEQIVQHAIYSVRRQTVQADVVTVHDRARHGAGWARNQGLAQVETDFTVFLDADDTLSPYFVERTLKAWQPKHYVYTDWLEDKVRRDAPHCAFVNGTFHVITTLIPTTYLRDAGGFDEELPAGEDTDLYLKLMTKGYCGLHLRDALFTYGANGQRSKALVERVVDGKPVYTPFYRELMDRFTRTYGSKPAMCCGENTVWEDAPAGERMEGDILVEAAWGGNKRVRGSVTGRLYPRTGNNKPLWAAPEDAYAAPSMFRVVAIHPEPVLPEAMDVFEEAFRIEAVTPTPVTPLPDTAPQATPKPDISKVIGAYKRD